MSESVNEETKEITSVIENLMKSFILNTAYSEKLFEQDFVISWANKREAIINAYPNIKPDIFQAYTAVIIFSSHY